ncbi:MAG TPA: hypothetical protein VGQ37_00005 [Vicinamibacterales bacterium]|nr:hypothetical protein [Vicinamibacterales bacterium]
MTRPGPLVVLVLCAAVQIACGGDGDTTPPTTPPSSSPPPATTAQNPCPPTRALVANRDGSQADKARQPTRVDPRGTLGDILWRHRAAEGRLRPLAAAAPGASADVGDVAVIQDEGDIIAPPNGFDLQGTGLRFAPRAGSYDVSRIDASFQAAIGDPVSLQDDDSVPGTVTFPFTFYGVQQTAAFINSDGNVTFGEAEHASTSRSISRLLSGPPRVGPFFADLDPSAGGAVYLRSAPEAFTVTWCGVPVFDSPRRTTFQTSLLPDGTIEMKFAPAATWSAVDGITAVSPGRTSAFTPVDLSTTSTASPAGNSGAVGERFAQRASLDLVAAARKFYSTHADLFDQLVVWTDDVMTPEDAFAFESTVANNITGIGVDIFDFSRQLNSTGRLSSVVQMDAIAKYPADPATKFLGENNTLSVLGQEVGHRWLAYLRFSDHNRQPSEALLGRDAGHWSFFLDSDASVMEGNRIEDLGGGSFRTVGAVEKYSLLDQYAMGLVRDVDVPKMFYVESPVNASSSVAADSGPRIGVSFSGTRRDVLINDVIAVMGARSPSADSSPKIHRQAFLFVVSKGKTADATAIAKIDRIRRAWEPFFAQATGNRGHADTRLQSGS